MDWSNGFAERIQAGATLAEKTWFGLGGQARYMFSPENEAELAGILRSAGRAGIPVRVLGGGANLLVRDEGFDGLVIRLDRPAFTGVSGEDERLEVGGGVDLMKLSRDCSYRGLSGLECMAGIPGTVGGAVRMNAGGRFGQFCDVVEAVRLMDRTGAVEEIPRSGMGFGYRTSNVGERIVIGAALRLTRKPVEEARSEFQRIWKIKKDSQPMADHSAGCIFKNPPGDSAGRLIDAAGLKGKRWGKARVSEVHGNFIVADEGATARDVIELLNDVRETVFARTGIRLEPEIDVW